MMKSRYLVLALLHASIVACSSSDESATPAGDSGTTIDTAAGDTPTGDTATNDSVVSDSTGDAGCPVLPEDENKPHFNYDPTSEEGPGHWGEIKKKDGTIAYPACADGTVQQSPIALPASGSLTTGTFGLGAELAWSATAGVKGLWNNGHTWQANMVDGLKLKVGADDYTLAQFHFHAPSEHSIDGKSFPMEMHFVHLAPTATPAKQPIAAVVGVMFEEDTADNPELAKIWDKFSKCPQAAAESVTGIAIDLTKLLPTDKSYYKYDGSLTTPACSTAVRFHLLANPIKASKSQIAAFSGTVGKDNRPTQPTLAGTTVTFQKP